MNVYKLKKEINGLDFFYWDEINKNHHTSFDMISENINKSNKESIKKIIEKSYVKATRRPIEIFSLAYEIFDQLKWCGLEDAFYASQCVLAVGAPDIGATGINIAETLQYCAGHSGYVLSECSIHNKRPSVEPGGTISAKVGRLIGGVLCAVHVSAEILSIYSPEDDCYPQSLKLEYSNYHDLLEIMERNNLGNAMDIIKGLKYNIEKEIGYLFSD